MIRQRQFVQVVEQVGPSVVLIRTSQGLGSGIVFDDTGNVVTNAHVVEGPAASRSPWPTAGSPRPGWSENP